MANLLTFQPRFIIVWLLGAVILLTAVYRDARARDAQPGLWVASIAIATLFLPPAIGMALGLLAYVLIRPKGALESCPHCGTQHLHWLMTCPKCRGALKRDCHRCRHVYPYKESRCPECGAPS